MILESRSLVTCGEGVRHSTTPVQGQSFVLLKPYFLEIGSKKHDFGIGFRGFACMAGFEVWLLNGCGPNLWFPKAFKQSTKFPRQKSSDMSLYFSGRI